LDSFVVLGKACIIAITSGRSSITNRMQNIGIYTRPKIFSDASVFSDRGYRLYSTFPVVGSAFDLNLNPVTAFSLIHAHLLPEFCFFLKALCKNRNKRLNTEIKPFGFTRTCEGSGILSPLGTNRRNCTSGVRRGSIIFYHFQWTVFLGFHNSQKCFCSFGTATFRLT